jgi:hypothetical protein
LCVRLFPPFDGRKKRTGRLGDIASPLANH